MRACVFRTALTAPPSRHAPAAVKFPDDTAREWVGASIISVILDVMLQQPLMIVGKTTLFAVVLGTV